MGQKGRFVLASDPKTANTNWSSGPVELKEVSQQRTTFNCVDICFSFIYFIMCMCICISVYICIYICICGFMHTSVVPAETRKGHWIP